LSPHIALCGKFVQFFFPAASQMPAPTAKHPRPWPDVGETPSSAQLASTALTGMSPVMAAAWLARTDPTPRNHSR